MTLAQKEVTKFFGKKNFKGLYSKNPLAYTPEYAKFNKTKSFITSYPVQGKHMRSDSTVDWPAVFSDSNSSTSRKPFPENQYTIPNRLVGNKLKNIIVTAHENGESVQKLSFRLGISVPRVDAIIRLDAVRKEVKKQQTEGSLKYLRKDIEKMAKTMTSLFDMVPIKDDGTPVRAVDNLTEIPMPKETRKQMFESIAESEPFGPVDAAKILGIEPAATTLEKLTNIEVESEQSPTSTQPKSRDSFFAELLEGERNLLKFTNAKVGHVGYRYGASRDDQKSGRKVVHTPDGRATYPPPAST